MNPGQSIIGLDIGGTKCAVSRLEPDGTTVREYERFATSGPDQTLAKLAESVRALGPSPDTCLGISCGGPLDAGRGLILSPPNLPGWDEIDIVSYFQRQFQCRAFLMNDANACALAEWQFGAGQGESSLVFLTAGTGMGAGLILDNRLYEGVSGTAGEVGHVRLSAQGPVGFGKAGSFEGFCSGGGIGRLAHMRGFGGPEITARDVGEAAARGHAGALDILRESGKRLGQALAILIDILNPGCIILGSVYVRCQRWLEPPMKAVLERECLPEALRACRIVPAALGESIGNYAAVAVAKYHLSLSLAR